MASQHIDINGNSTRLASEVRQLVDHARNLQERAAKVKKIMAQVSSGDDWVALGAYLGIPSDKAQLVSTMLTAFSIVINKADYDAFVDRLG